MFPNIIRNIFYLSKPLRNITYTWAALPNRNNHKWRNVTGVPGIILCMCPTKEKRRCISTSSLNSYAHTQNDPWGTICRKRRSIRCCIDYQITHLAQMIYIYIYAYIYAYIYIYIYIYIYADTPVEACIYVLFVCFGEQLYLKSDDVHLIWRQNWNTLGSVYGKREYREYVTK